MSGCFSPWFVLPVCSNKQYRQRLWSWTLSLIILHLSTALRLAVHMAWYLQYILSEVQIFPFSICFWNLPKTTKYFQSKMNFKIVLHSRCQFEVFNLSCCHIASVLQSPPHRFSDPQWDSLRLFNTCSCLKWLLQMIHIRASSRLRVSCWSYVLNAIFRLLNTGLIIQKCQVSCCSG